MANNYIGINNIAKKSKKFYIGVDGIAREVKKIYNGVNGIARLSYESGPQPRAAYFTFSSSNAFTISATKKWNGKIEYSFDTYNWIEWDGSAISSTLNGDKQVLYFSGTGNSVVTNKSPWNISGSNVSCYGSNVETLLDWETVSNNKHPTMLDKAFSTMFSNCTALVVGPSLLSTKLPTYCYSNMFYGCTNLKTISSCLPAAAVQTGSYSQMFYGCTSLMVLPLIKATMYMPQCCTSMFYGCSNIKFSSTKNGAYSRTYRIPYQGIGQCSGYNQFTNMFTKTGGTYTENPVVNTIYYTSNSLQA